MGYHRRDFQQPLSRAPRVSLPIETDDGIFAAEYSASGLAALHFPGAPFDAASVPVHLREWHALTESAIRSVLEGRDPERLPPLDLSGHTDFQRSVWAEMRKLKPGQTASYGELAIRLAIPGAARAVGNACGANPIPLLIPCHRILASGGRLGGFSGGLAWKRKLLEREGVRTIEQAAKTDRLGELFLLKI
jgi:methylated-DNA-[protein]-cysteine S-methyltransferase